MAKLKVYTVFDSKTEHYGTPFFQQTTGEALRSWTDLANDSSTMICKHPEDFSLMEIGVYDDLTGAFENRNAPLNLGLASQFKHKPEIQDNLFNMKIGS